MTFNKILPNIAQFQLTTKFRLRNLTEHEVHFEVKENRETYSFKPNVGVLSPKQVIRVQGIINKLSWMNYSK
jgi:hypothetical protein